MSPKPNNLVGDWNVVKVPKWNGKNIDQVVQRPKDHNYNSSSKRQPLNDQRIFNLVFRRKKH